MSDAGRGHEEQKETAGKFKFMYGRGDEKAVKYEICELPMQNKVATVRRAVSKNWNYVQTEVTKIRKATRSYVCKTRQHIRSSMERLGVANSQVSLQAGTIGGAALVGVFLARKKSLFLRVASPIAAATGVWSLFYFSSSSNRETAKKRSLDLLAKLRQRSK